MYPADSKLTVYCDPCWWSDKLDGGEYAREYDPTKPFFEQLKELNEATPQMALEANYPTLVNSEYINHAATAKNCYLIFLADECENVLYSEVLLHIKDSMDTTIFEKAELCYEVINCGNSYRLFYSEDCDSCHDVSFSKDCIGCSNCFGCIGLRSKQYHIFNQPYSKDEYERKIKEFNLGSRESIMRLKQKARTFWLSYPHKFSHSLRNANTTGDYVYGAKNAKDMYLVSEGTEDSRYCQIMTMPGVKDSYDYTLWGNGAQRIYETMTAGEGADNIKFSFQTWPNVHDIEYSMATLSSSYMFGCANIRNKQYCILNKQYSKEEYETLRQRIISDMNEKPYADSLGRAYPYGEYFPPSLSLFGYNETYAAGYFPLSRKEAEEMGLSWYEAQPKNYTITIKGKDLPDTIAEIQDSIIQEVIECVGCRKAFRIVSAELDLLRRFQFPLPQHCPNCRYQERWARVNPPRLYPRPCQCVGAQSENESYKNQSAHSHGKEKCPNTFQTSYAPDRPEIVYCETCYQSEVA